MTIKTLALCLLASCATERAVATRLDAAACCAEVDSQAVHDCLVDLISDDAWCSPWTCPTSDGDVCRPEGDGPIIRDHRH